VLISDSSRLLFIHVPKTGGMSVRGVLLQACPDLEEVEPRHATLKQSLAKRPELAEYVIVGFVRNPWDRLVSWWSMIHSAPERPEGHRHRRFLLQRPHWRYVAEFNTFEDFIRDIPTTPHQRFRRPQLRFLTTRKRSADFIGRTENFEQDVAQMLSLIGHSPVKVPHWNKSPRPRSYRELYTPETEEIVRRVYKPDVEAFGYRF
jgi:hypothetical protein